MIAALLLALAAGPNSGPVARARAVPPADSAHGTVITDTLWSQSLGTKKAVVVYLPPSYATSPSRRYPVAYYLHGAFGSEADWTMSGHLNEVMDSLVAAHRTEMIVVMPDGDDGWYTTWNALVTYDACRRTAPARERAETYCVPWEHYDDYIARDVVQFTDKTFRTRADRAHRAIAGLSMGGYGAMALAFEYPRVWSAAASHSGVLAPLYVGPTPFDGRPKWAASAAELEQWWGPTFWPLISPAFGRDTAAWWSRDPGRRLAHLVAAKGKSAVPALFVDCGTEDGLVNENRAFKAQAEALGVPVVYHEWSGKHDWAYWRAHEVESLAWIAGRVR
ncbi:MAG: alpha/beta hydrolase [Gemmatimonadales bacterium]